VDAGCHCRDCLGDEALGADSGWFWHCAAMPPEGRSFFVSLRLTLAKIGLAVLGFAAGLSIGRDASPR
jgi:hypothetical protein